MVTCVRFHAHNDGKFINQKGLSVHLSSCFRLFAAVIAETDYRINGEISAEENDRYLHAKVEKPEVEIISLKLMEKEP